MSSVVFVSRASWRAVSRVAGLAALLALCVWLLGASAQIGSAAAPQALPEHTPALPAALAGWSFEASLDDSSGNGYHLSEAGGGSYYAAGCQGQALHFNNDPSNYLTRPGDDPAFDFGFADYSIALWVNFDQLPNSSREQTLIEKCSGDGCTLDGWGLSVMNNNAIRFIQNTGSHNFLDSPGIDFRAGVWHHIAAVRQGSAAYLYVDGVQVASGPAWDLADTAAPLIIGRRFDENQQFPLAGFLDEVTLYNAALSASDVQWLHQSGAACQMQPAPLHILIYDDYEEDHYSNSLREYLVARGHSVTYLHDNVGLVDVWPRYSNYDVILAIHTTGGGTLTNLQSWFQNGRGYVAMLGDNMWGDAEDSYIRNLLGAANNTGDLGSGWQPDQLAWADPTHPITSTPNAGWDLFRLPWGQYQYYIDIAGGHTVVSAPAGAVLQTLEGVEGAARLAVFGSNYHGEERTDPEARRLVENILVWSASVRPAAWFDPDATSHRSTPGSLVAHQFDLVNRAGYAASFNLSLTGNTWPAQITDQNDVPISATGVITDHESYIVKVNVTIPPGATTDEFDEFTLAAVDSSDPAISTTVVGRTSAPGPARRVYLNLGSPQVSPGGATLVTANVTDQHGVPVVDGTPVTFTLTAGGTLSPLTGSTVGGAVTSVFTGSLGCTLAEIQAVSGEGWNAAYISVSDYGPTDIWGGDIISDTTWTACNSPYLIHNSITVFPGVTLTLEAGVQARFDEDTHLLTLGTLVAEGEPQAHALFTANTSSPWPGYWQGIIVGDDAQAASAQLDYAAISYAGRWQGFNSSAFLLWHGTANIANSRFYQNQGYGLWAEHNTMLSFSGNAVRDNENGLAVRSAQIAVSDNLLPSTDFGGSLWRYTAFNAPPAGWNSDPGFDDSGWDEGRTAFCDGAGCPTYLELEGSTMYARTFVTPTFPAGATYYLRAARDDSVYVWVNGILVIDEPHGGGAQWTQYIPISLAAGANLIAVEMQDGGGGGNYFDLELVGGTPQQPAILQNQFTRNGQGIYIERSAPLIENNLIWELNSDGIFNAGDSSPLIRNNLIHHNQNNGIRIGTGGIGGWPRIYNNTIDSNNGTGIAWDNWWTDQPDIQNNIVTNNVYSGIACRDTRGLTRAYNDAWGNGWDFEDCSNPDGPGNFSANPIYTNPNAGDYHLQLGSPAIDAGNPDPAFDDVDATRNDAGAYGGPAGESYPYVDVSGPLLDWITAQPPVTHPGGDIVLQAYLWDPSGVAWVTADIESPDETIIASVTLYDDGAHNDGAPGDSVYGNAWTTPAGEASYWVDVSSADGAARQSEYDNAASFRTHTPVLWVVTTTADSGASSLRQALLDADHGDTITFDPLVFPPASPAAIMPASPLPVLSIGGVSIDAADAGVILDGSALTSGDGLSIGSDDNLIQGLIILDFPGSGIWLHDGASGNQIGGDPETGSAPFGQGNIIANNRGSGVRIEGLGSDGNTLTGNLIGPDLDGARLAYPVDMALSPAYASDCTIYVATQNDGVSKSTDCGTSWFTANNGLTETRLLQVKIPPNATDANTVFALAENGYLFQTTDGGANWALVSTQPEQFDRRSLALSAGFSSDQTLYAAAQDWAWQQMGDQPGVFKSTDGGVTWARQSSGLNETNIWKVVASPDPAAKDTLFALSRNNTIQKSNDGAANWFGLPNPAGGINDLAVSPNYSVDQTVFVAGNDGRIYRSTDGGWNWQGFDTQRGDPRFLALSPDFGNDHTLCHGGGWNDWAYCSTDNAETWTAHETGLVGHLADAGAGMAFSPAYASDETIFALTYVGMARSTDAGWSWQTLRSLNELGNREGVWIGGQASGNTIGPGNVIGNNMNGVIVSNDSQNNLITGNHIGVDLPGTTPIPNPGDGVNISGPNNQVVGNLIGGNMTDGVRIAGEQATGNLVAGNFIGASADGLVLRNEGAGVSIHSGAHDNLVGGDTPAERNIISGNGYGIGIWDWNTYANTVSGNYIGTDAAGVYALGNGNGIQIHDWAHDNWIGGDTPEERNVISGNWQGIHFRNDAHDNVVSGNYIGVDASGASTLPNHEGVALDNAHSNRIGGATAGERNVISGNAFGIPISNNSHDNVVIGNYIGVDASGSVALANGEAGVTLFNDAYNNRVGGVTGGERNVISGNWRGIGLGFNAHDNEVIGNYIGVDASGLAALPNGDAGVTINGSAHNNRIGGATAGERNLISGNHGNGVAIEDTGTSDNIVQGNWIGVDASGTQPLPNGGAVSPAPVEQAQKPPSGMDETDLAAMPPTLLAAILENIQPPLFDNPAGARAPERSNDGAGVFIAWGASDNIVGPDNVIAFNGKEGVYMEGGDTLRNTLTQNSIFYNESAGILLRDGANANLDAPYIDFVDISGGTASGTSCPNCTIEVFSASDDEGKIYEGSTVADGTGNWSLVAGHSLTGPNVTATATDAEGNTSPFAQLFDLLVFDLNVPQTLWALDNLGLRYTLVDSDTFASLNLADYDVFFVGFTGNDPQPDDLLQALLNRRADIAAFVQNGGALVVNSEDGVVATPLDWQWTPVTVTHQNSGGAQMFFATPEHGLLEGLSEADLFGWAPYHNIFTAWDWPEAEVVLRDNHYGDAIVLAGSYGSGRMVLSGSDPDYHDGKGPEKLLYNELLWAAGALAEEPPRVTSAKPWAGADTAERAVVTFAFSQAVDAATVHSGSVTALGSASGAISGEVRYYAELAQGDFVPDAPFVAGERVTVTLSAAIQDMTGNGLDGDGDHIAEGSPQDDYSWSFTVRSGETIVVDSMGDEWETALQGTTLRQALQWAQPGDTITFDPAVFPPASPQTIFVENGDLPCLWQGYVTLDATSAGVILDGSRGPGWGINLCSDGNIVQGLRLQYFSDTALYVSGAYNQVGGSAIAERNVFGGNGRAVYLSSAESRQNTVAGNFIGVDSDGITPFPNQWEGVRLDTLANHNLIGGGLPGAGNLISGNRGFGVYLEGAAYNVIAGNFIGTDASGLAALGNGSAGVEIGYGSRFNTVGGTASGERNVISANGGHGVNMGYATDNHILGNYAGVDITGNAALGNNGHGIAARWAGFRNVVGGSAPGEGNVASGNHAYGIRFWDSSQSAITGNLVGFGADGVTPLGNDLLEIGVFYSNEILVEENALGNGPYGLWLIESRNVQVRANRIGLDAAGNPAPIANAGVWVSNGNSQGVTIGGPAAEDGNVIAYCGAGVEIRNDGGDTFAISLAHNSIFANSGLGIELLNGANHNVVAPVIVSADPATGMASGTACAFCTVEVFSDDDDEGRWFEGVTAADGTGNWILDTDPFTGNNVHATATDGEGNTSEFSGPPPTVSAAAPNEATPGTMDLGVTLTGADFRDNAPLSVDFGAGIAVAALEYHHTGELKAYINLDAGAAFGPRDITVTNYDGQSGVLSGGFNVVDVPPPPPAVSAVIPGAIVPGVSAELIVLGEGFIDRPTAYFTGTGVTVDGVTFHEPGKISLWVTIAPDAPLGARAVVVANPDGQSASLSDSLILIAPLFEEVAASAGVADVGDGLGVAWGDYNSDGYPDLYTARGADYEGEPDILYHNLQNGMFTDANPTAGTGDAGAGFGAAWGDYDNDGDLDLFVSRYWQANLLYANNGDGTFDEAGAAAGVDHTGDSAAAAWADYDRDGWLDLFVTGEYGANILYHNNGDGTFTDVTTAAGIPDDGGREESAAWGDYDGDGYPDLYLTNANGSNRLYRNHGDGSFGDVSAAAGVDDGRLSRSAAWGDYDNDGDLDLFVANYGAQNALYRNNGDGTFSDIAADAGIYAAYGSIGVTTGDFDNNGWLDIFVAGDGSKQLYLNQGGGVFWPHYEPALFLPGYTHSAAAADYDNDGDLDVYAASRWDGNPNLLYRNLGGDQHWLRVHLLGVLSNASGVGARVRVVSGGLSMSRVVSGGSGYASQDSLPVEFGLGALDGAVTVEVYWPSGVVDSLSGVAVDQAITVVESTPYLHDLAVAAASPAGEFPVDTPLVPAAMLRNFGQFGEDGVPVVCTIEHNAVTVYNETLYTPAIPPAVWSTLVFPAFTPSEAGDYTLHCQSYLPGDERPENDQQTRQILVTEQVADAWTKDDPDDDGDVPSSWNNWYGSPDLWVRNEADGGLIHQDPIAGVENTVYVRLRNRGNTAVYTGTVSVYWIEPSLGVRCGDWALVGDVAFENLLPGEERIVSLPWTPTRTGHTCMQDVIDSPQDPFNRELECAPQWVPWDNNVEWHNLNILPNPDLGEGVMDIKEAQVHLVNIYDRSKDVDLIVDRLTFPLSGTITIQLPEAIFERWYGYGGSWSEGVEVDAAAKEIRVTGLVSATIGAIPMLAEEDVTVGLRFEGPAGLEFEMAVRERIDGLMTGGVAYQWAIPDTTPPQVASVNPGAGASGVGLSAPVVVTFAEPVGPLSLEFSASPDPGGWQFTWNAAGDVLTATHQAFSEGVTYNLSVSASDASGNAMSAPFSWSFTAASNILRIYLPLVLRSLLIAGR